MRPAKAKGDRRKRNCTPLSPPLPPAPSVPGPAEEALRLPPPLELALVGGGDPHGGNKREALDGGRSQVSLPRGEKKPLARRL